MPAVERIGRVAEERHVPGEVERHIPNNRKRYAKRRDEVEELREAKPLPLVEEQDERACCESAECEGGCCERLQGGAPVELLGESIGVVSLLLQGAGP